MTAAMDVDTTQQTMEVAAVMGNGPRDEENPATPAKGSAATSKEAAAGAVGESVETPPKASQTEIEADEEEDSNEALGLQLYYLLLRSLFKEMDLYAQPVEAGLLDAKKQMLVYHHAARLYELRVDVLGSLHGDFSLTANLPKELQKVTRKLRKKLQEQGQLERLEELKEKHVFGHDSAIRFMESNLPAGAKEHCVWLREKPHAASDVVKSISPFRDVIKFHCFRNPLMLIEDHAMGLALTIEKTFPVAYLVVSPFLKKPEILEKCTSRNQSWQHIEEELSEHLMNFIADDADGWRAFIQRRANIISKGSLATLQRALRLRPSKEGLDGNAVQALQDLQEEVEVLRERAKKAEETVAKQMAKESLALEGQLHKTEGKNIDLSIVAEQLAADKLRITKELEEKIQQQKILEERSSAAEKAVNDQREEQEYLRTRCSEAMDRQLAAEAAKKIAEVAELEANDRAAAMAEEASNKKSEAELLAGGVHEMMVELNKNNAQKKKALEQTKEALLVNKTLSTQNKKLESSEKEAVEYAQKMEAQAEEAVSKVEGLNGELEKLQAQEEQATDAIVQAELAADRAAAAEQKVKEAEATLQVKAEAVERMTASNVSLRAEAAMAAERVPELEAAKVEACEEAEKAREEAEQARGELQGVKDEVTQLENLINESKAAVVEAKADVEKEHVFTQEAERKAAEAAQSELEIAAKLTVNMEQVATLNSTCSGLRCEMATLTETLAQEINRAESAETAVEQATQAAAQFANEHSAQLEVKTRTVESLMESNVALRSEVVSSKSDAEQASQQAAANESARSKAQESEAQALKDVQARTADITVLRGSIEEEQAHVSAAKADAEKAHSLKKEAERRKDEACQAEADMTARLQVKNDDIVKLTSSCGSLTAQVAKLAESVEKEKERVEESKQTAREVSAQLEVKVQTVESMKADNTALRVTLISAKDKAEEAGKLVAAAEETVAKARKTEESTKEKLKKEKSQVAAHEATIAELRDLPEPSDELKAEMATVRAEAKESKTQAAESDRLAVEARAREAEAAARLQLKVEEQTRLVNECAALRAEAARLAEQNTLAEERATEAHLAEVNAKASLEYKTNDVERVCAKNVELRSEIIQANTEAKESTARAVKSEKYAEEAVGAAQRARDSAQAELRGKVAAAESMSKAIGAVRAEAEAARSAEAAALDVAKKASDEVDESRKTVLKAKKTEGQAVAKLQVKSEEAKSLTNECSSLRAEVELLREKSEASAKVVKALAATCEQFKAQLADSEAKHDWSKLQEPVPNFSASSKDDLTIEDVELALAAELTETADAEVEAAVAIPTTFGRRLRGKGPASRLMELASSAARIFTPRSSEAAASSAPAEAAAAKPRRARTPEPPVAVKRARVGGAEVVLAEVLDAD